MKPQELKTGIFLDGGNAAETLEIRDLLGFLDGQTTNPTLISKNPEARRRLEQGMKFTEREILDFYRQVVVTISGLVPEGSVSVEVFADGSTPAEAMLTQGREMYSWIRNARIKFPCSLEGLKAAEQAVKEGMRINMTLCFSQQQAAAVYAATRGATKGQVFVSPFVGRLDDQGENGMDVVANIIALYKLGDGHVQVLTASVRTLDHLLYALKLGSDVITAPFEILKAWGEQGMPLPRPEYQYPSGSLKPIPYAEIGLDRRWLAYDIRHSLTDKGMEKFSADWKGMIGQEDVRKIA
ncbi:MAG: transaldolase [Nitrospirae bacterium GWD2_57_9]|nr:MAG: transaldolase [Nitrospirae bacterium GWD2_57_9]